MPNRILKESIKRSDQIDRLTFFEEIVFYRLLVTADDYGCVDGRPIVLKNELFPTKESVTKKAIEDAILGLIRAGLIERYVVDELPYLHLLTWDKHQRLRNSKHKYPTPDMAESAENMDCVNSPQIAASFSETPPESNPNPNQKEKPTVSCAERSENRPTQSNATDELADVEAIPLTSGEEWRPQKSEYGEYCRLYPSVDVVTEFRKMRAWSLSNPKKQKTIRGVRKFVNNWLSNAQDRGKKAYSSNYGGFLND